MSKVSLNNPRHINDTQRKTTMITDNLNLTSVKSNKRALAALALKCVCTDTLGITAG